MVIILPIPTYFYNKRIYNMQVLQEHNIFSLVAHVGMESSSENSMYVVRDDVIFYLFNFQWSLFLCFPNQLKNTSLRLFFTMLIDQLNVTPPTENIS